MVENKKVFFVINKYSGTSFQPAVEGRIIDKCAEWGWECTIEYTKHRGHATELARDAAHQKFKIVFAMGGDGTVNEVAQGLIRTNTIMGILPKGSGNGLARHLRVPLNFGKALDLLVDHQVINMDTFMVNHHLSVNVSGIGFDGHIAGLFGKNGKRGLVEYTKLVMREFRTFKEFPISIKVDGQQLERNAFILAFANASQFGNNAQVAPLASVCDEQLDVCFIKKVPLTQIIGFAGKMFSGNIDKSAFVEIKNAKKIFLEFDKPMPFHIDGEGVEPAKSFIIDIQPASLKVLIPADAKRF
jgi:diacylglycerol kinase (ATP)